MRPTHLELIRSQSSELIIDSAELVVGEAQDWRSDIFKKQGKIMVLVFQFVRHTNQIDQVVHDLNVGEVSVPGKGAVLSDLHDVRPQQWGMCPQQSPER